MNTKYIQIIRYKLPPQIITLILFLQLSIFALLILRTSVQDVVSTNNQCDIKIDLDIADNFSKLLAGKISNNHSQCFNFYARKGKKLFVNTPNKITLLSPSKNAMKILGKQEIIVQQSGEYSIVVDTDKLLTVFEVNLKLEDNIAPKSDVKIIKPLQSNLKHTENTLQLSYNVVTHPAFKANHKLQEIVNNIVELVQSKGLPVDRLSVSLVDLNSSECCAYASYSDREPRFPASVAKLFWMVYLFGQYQAGVLPEGIVPAKKLLKMIQDSDNESASFIVDKITGTEPGESLPPDEIQKWMEKRSALNLFFEKAGYSQINVSQKVFPTDYTKNDEPAGRDLQIRGEDKLKPIRNYVNTYNLTRLLFEIYTDKALSKKYNSKMQSLLRRDLHKSAWKGKPFNAIEGFLGESLPENAYFASKMGWNFSTRNDAAIIGSPDGKHKYILVVFGDHPSFYGDKKIYPEISLMVYKSMTNQKS